jgi:1,4-alpha-glucan branching enzyme
MLVPPHKLRAISAVYLLAPQIPMLFMGEEWNARQPFQFFCDFTGDLAEAVRHGRREEFKRFPEFADPERRERIPDPLAAETFAASKLHWEDRGLPECAGTLRWYQRILATRRACIVPLIPRIRAAGIAQIIATNAVFVSWRAGDGHRLRLCANLSDEPREFPTAYDRVVWHEGGAPRETTLPPWTVRWTVREP